MIGGQKGTEGPWEGEIFAREVKWVVVRLMEVACSGSG